MAGCLKSLISRVSLVRQVSIALISVVIVVSVIYSLTDDSFRISLQGLNVPPSVVESPQLPQLQPHYSAAQTEITATAAASPPHNEKSSKVVGLISNSTATSQTSYLRSNLSMPTSSSRSFNNVTIPVSKTITGPSTTILTVKAPPPSRQLARQPSGALFDVNALGTSSLVPNKTVFGAIIMSDYGESNLELTKTWKDDISGTGGQKLSTAAEMASMRSKNARDMIAQLPFPVVHWPPIFTKPCPYSKNQHKTERGLAFAHLQIWLDFVYFDADVISAYKRGDVKGKGVYTNTAFSSVSGTYSVAENGTLYKNGRVFSEDDIIVIFEDDADIAVVNINETMIDEFSAMTTDLLFLGWCKGRAARPVPLCAHAYAMTRRGARKAVEHFEPCGLALDEQLVIFGKNSWLSYRTAHTWNWEKKFNSQYPKAHDKTYGLFHQKRMGSFNGH